MYVREEMQERLWPSIVTGNWDDKKLKAARYMMVGTNNRAIFEGMLAGLRFHKELGSDAVYKRIHSLARTVLERARKSPHLELLTPDDDRMFGSLVTVKVKSGDHTRLLDACRKKRIWVLQADRIRISTHVHTRQSDIDAFFATVDEVYGKSRV
jgi:selenocysteine lyase/cysteine desulfurase